MVHVVAGTEGPGVLPGSKGTAAQRCCRCLAGSGTARRSIFCPSGRLRRSRVEECLRIHRHSRFTGRAATGAGSLQDRWQRLPRGVADYQTGRLRAGSIRIGRLKDEKVKSESAMPSRTVRFKVVTVSLNPTVGLQAKSGPGRF